MTGLFLAMGVLSLWPLQQIFTDLEHIATEGAMVRDRTNELSLGVSNIELELYRIQSGQTHRLDALIEQMDQLNGITATLGEHYVMHEPKIRSVYEQMVERIQDFQRHVSVLSTTSDPLLAADHNIEALSVAAALRADATRIFHYVSSHVEQEQVAVTSWFRWLVIGIALGFIIVVNISIMAMLRTARMILDPVDRLVAASRELAQEHFDHRVELAADDEFAELGRAYNHLADQLEQNEQRRMEMLQQVALTLNHELNNAMAVIELQLQLISRRSREDGGSRPHLEHIKASLKRMAGVVESLNHVKQIVLTDYAQGVKMLDLERSVAENDRSADVR